MVERLIRTYRDDETLPRGESIGPSLFQAIRGSKIAVVIFSRNYANSSWCLDELAYIMNNVKVGSWRIALVDASNIAGWEPKPTGMNPYASNKLLIQF
ncbi:hypothetical protein L1987_71744 [Smallanthus sonchifolius]|uniref:Uncharacterized protein n=1 Tax=Smallanthus sonchifolius TaxID=185202 RepID=A0ACB9AUM8_9ASTR|nr:hypothetical protein L1987_71744 [Smallanthus sonchifolius]